MIVARRGSRWRHRRTGEVAILRQAQGRWVVLASVGAARRQPLWLGRLLRDWERI
ncbi:MAG: hypothetical protein ACLP50_32960 [Solirubrobacteraceae bacterium]